MSNCRTGRTVLLLAFTGLFLISSLAFAQDSDSLPSIEKKRPNSLKAGAWALQFQITQDFTLKDFQGMLISAKRHYSKGKAIRFGIGLSASLTDSDDWYRSFQNDTIVGGANSELENNGQSVDLIGQYVIYRPTDAKASFYFGGGLVGSYSRSKSNSASSSGSRNSQTTQNFAIGLSGVFGAEWFATKNIGLLAEYGVTLKYNWTRSNYKSSSGIFSNTGVRIQRTIGINPAIVKLGLSVYF